MQAKSDPSGEVFVSEESITWGKKALRKSPLLSTVKINIGQSNSEKADSSSMTTRLMERDRQKVRQTLRDANTDLRLHLPYAVHSAGHFTCIISLNLQNQ